MKILGGISFSGVWLRLVRAGYADRVRLGYDQNPEREGTLMPASIAKRRDTVQELLADEKYSISTFERLVYEMIKEELQPYEGRSVDSSRTRFLLIPSRKSVPTRIICEVRRVDPSLLDLDIVFGETGPRLDAGPPPSVIPESWVLEYRIWEPYWLDYPDPKTYADQLRPFLRDWFEGRLTLVTTYAGTKAYSWILKRGEEVLGKKRLRIFPYFAKRRTVSQHT
ncbi:MAG: hypothetical protein IH983_00390 [Planctomycetes bacterium]|nr:hypothetical protein [Planctomycetota bacterium]